MALVGQDGEQISKLWDGRMGRQSDVLPDRVVETPIDRVRSYSEVEKKLTELEKAKEIAIKLPGGRGHWVGPMRGESFEEHARRYRQQREKGSIEVRGRVPDEPYMSNDTVKEIARDQLRVTDVFGPMNNPPEQKVLDPRLRHLIAQGLLEAVAAGGWSEFELSVLRAAYELVTRD